MNRSLPVLFSAILVIVIIAAYHHTLSSPFVLDDELNIVYNPYIQIESLGLDDLKKVFSPYRPSHTRPVANLSFALNYLFNGYNPAGFHIVNIFIHIITSIIIFRLFVWYCRKTEYSENDSLRLALFGALLWALNPIQTNAVTYIIQRMTSLSTLFFVSSLLVYLYGRDLVGSDENNDAKVKKGVFFTLSLLFFVLAMMTKEIAIILPVIILLHEVFFFQGFSREKLSRNKYYYLVILLIPFFAGIFYMGPGFWKIVVQGYADRDFTMSERLLTQSRVVVRYFSLFLLPLPSRLNLFYNYQVSHSLFNPVTTFMSILTILFLISGACLLARKYPLISFGILWTFFSLILESSFIPLELIFEHRFYLPSIGLSLALVVLSFRLFALFPLNRLFLIGFWVGTAGLLLVMTYQRNQDWRSLVSIYADGVQKAPDLVRVVNGLGVAYMRAGEVDKAEQTYQKGLKLDPGNIALLANTYTLYSNHYDRRAAEPYLERLNKSVREKHFQCNESISIILLSEVLAKQKRYGEVIFLLESIANCTIKNAIYYDNLGFCYSRRGNHRKAIENFSKAVELEPGNPYNLFFLSREYLWAGDKDRATLIYSKLHGLSLPDDLKPHVNRLDYYLDHQ